MQPGLGGQHGKTSTCLRGVRISQETANAPLGSGHLLLEVLRNPDSNEYNNKTSLVILTQVQMCVQTR